jgi:hypothetical protein
MDNLDNIFFNGIEIPKCPFLWNYENQFIHPVINWTHIDLTEKFDDLIINLNNIQHIEKIKKFKKDYLSNKTKNFIRQIY